MDSNNNASSRCINNCCFNILFNTRTLTKKSPFFDNPITGGVFISYDNFDDILASPQLDLININLERGVSPGRICSFLKKRYKCPCNSNKLYAYRSVTYPEVVTNKKSILIENMDELDAELADGVESITIDDVKNIAMKLNVKCGTRLLEDLDNNDKLKGNTVQLYASTLRTILSFQDDVNNTQTTESLSDLLHDDTIMMLNDRAEAK